MKTSPAPWRRAFLHGVIDHTDDSMVATLAAIELGSTEGSVACGLHPQWVLGQQQEKVEFALWAVQNCHDNDALAEIAEATNRSTVLRAIAESPWAFAETRERAAQRVRASYTGAGTLVPPQLAVAPSFITYDVANPLMHMPRGLETRQVAPYVVTELIDGAYGVNAVATVSAIVNDYYGAYPGNALWETYPVNVVALVARLNKTQRSQVFNSLLNTLRQARAKRAHLMNEDMLELLMSEVEAPTAKGIRITWFHTTRTGQYGRTFVSNAFNVLLASPEWHHLLEAHLPSPKQFKKILATVNGEEREHWLIIIRETRLLLRIALDYKGPGALSDTERTELLVACGHNITRLTDNKEDDFFAQVISLLGDKHLSAYVVNGLVCGQTRETTARVFPEDSEIPGLVSRVVEESAWEDAFSSGVNDIAGTNEERARTLCEHVPGAWRLLVSHPILGDEIRAALVSSDLGLQEIVHRLYSQESPLYTFSEAKAALGV